MEIRDLQKKDHKKAIQFAIKGMHFEWYTNSKILLNAYGRYFWYSELNRATRVYAAYEGEQFVGVLLAEVYGEQPQCRMRHERLYVRIVDRLMNLFSKDGAGLYESTVAEQHEHYLTTHKPDGEILFLAVDLNAGIKGVGSALLKAFEGTMKGKTFYLNTDDVCTYQFYEHRGFQRVEERDIVLKMTKGDVPLKCLVYSKRIT